MNRLICANVQEAIVCIPDDCIQSVITSPPYWGLRDYGLEPIVWDGIDGCEHEWTDIHVRSRGGHNKPDNPSFIGANKYVQTLDAIRGSGYISSFCIKCNAWRGSLGLEPSPELYIKHLVDIFEKVKRVLRSDGTVWLNISDSYFGGGNNKGNTKPLSKKQSSNEGATGQCAEHHKNVGKHSVLKPKDLSLIPFRLAIALQEAGWWIRSDIIWHKPNPMPESVKDRPTRSHEHVFLLSKSRRYYYDADAIREPHTWIEKRERPSGMARGAQKYRDKVKYGGAGSGFAGHSGGYKADGALLNHPIGRNKRTVWTVNTQSYQGAHFATFPEKLIEPMILAGSSDKACEHCGAAWKLTIETYEPTCDCEDNTGSASSIILDPFAGSGTTCAVAKRLGRRYVGIEANKEYIELAECRIQAASHQLELYQYNGGGGLIGIRLERKEVNDG